MLSDTRWVPVERRWLGLDRRSLGPAILVAAVGLLWGVLLPMVDRAVPGHDVVRPGDRLDLGQGLTITPPPGWQIVQGVRVGAGTRVPVGDATTAELTGNGVSATVRVAPFAGDATALLDQVDRDGPGVTARSGRSPIHGADGAAGLVDRYAGTAGEEAVAAYALADGRGVVIRVEAGGGQFGARAREINAMLTSVTGKGRP